MKRREKKKKKKSVTWVFFWLPSGGGVLEVVIIHLCEEAGRIPASSCLVAGSFLCLAGLGRGQQNDLWPWGSSPNLLILTSYVTHLEICFSFLLMQVRVLSLLGAGTQGPCALGLSIVSGLRLLAPAPPSPRLDSVSLPRLIFLLTLCLY